jgi:L-2-hydroxyglutarate oxidase
VVSRNEEEDSRLGALFMRGLENSVDIELLDASQLHRFEPLAITHERFLWSPTTAVSDPKAITYALRKEFEALGGSIHFNTKIELSSRGNEIYESTLRYNSDHIINAAGAQADKISRKIGVGKDYAMVPFMGIYQATEEKYLPLKRLVYPVPHPVNPFLGVHFTLTIDHKVKVGPTAIPIVGREQYSLLSGWSGADFIQTLIGMNSLIKGDSHQLRSIIKSEWPKIIQQLLIKESQELVPSAADTKHWYKKPPGIRAQLIHLSTGQLVQDFIVEKKFNSTHILNAVSPGWTCAIPFGAHIASLI